VLAGEDAVKSAGEKYLPRLDSHSDEEFLAYRKRASFFNATARSAEGFVGLIFRRPPFIKVPEVQSPRSKVQSDLAGRASYPDGATRRSGDTAPYLSHGIAKALAEFVNDADMQGTTLSGYAKNVVSEVVGVGRARTATTRSGCGLDAVSQWGREPAQNFVFGIFRVEGDPQF
jgi:hypothetical protein